MSAGNPFEVLALDPTATEEQIVQQAGRCGSAAPTTPRSALFARLSRR